MAGSIRKREFLVNFDSLVDIVSNINGILILIGAITALIVLTKSFLIQTQLATGVQAVETEQERVSFECRNNKIVPVYEDDFNVARATGKFWSNGKSYYRTFASEYRWYLAYEWDGRPIVIKKRKKTINLKPKSHYKNIEVEMEIDLALNEDGDRAIYLYYRYEMKPKFEDQGESAEQAKDNNSEFLSEINKINPDSQFVYFFVYPDSYRIFRTLRKALQKRNIDFGWTPKKEDEYIAFSLHGEKSRKSDFASK